MGPEYLVPLLVSEKVNQACLPIIYSISLSQI